MSLDDFQPNSVVGKLMKEKLAKKNGRSAPTSTPPRRNEKLEAILAKSSSPSAHARPKPSSNTAKSLSPRPGNPPQKQTQPYRPDPNAVDKFRGMHDFFIENKLFLTDAHDMKFKCHKTHKVTKNGSVKAIQAKESYSSHIVFQLLTSIGFNWRGTKRNNTLLATGDPGLGKTLLAEHCGKYIFHQTPEQIAEATIQGHPQQTAESMVAQYDLPHLMKGEKKVLKNPWTSNKGVHNVDEIGRLPEEMIGILLRLLDDGRMRYCDEVIEMETGPVTGTMNLDSASGPLFPAAKDRFQVSLPYLAVNPNFLQALISDGGKKGAPLNIPKELYIDENTIRTAREEIRKIKFDKTAVRKLSHYISQINNCDQAGATLEYKNKSNAQNRKPSEGLCVGCHYKDKLCAYFDNSISMRAFESILTYSAEFAWFRKKDTVEEEDIVEVLARVLPHRMEKTQKAIETKKIWGVDDINFIKETWNQASAQFVKYQNSIPEFNKMLDDLDDPHKLAYSTKGNTQDLTKRLEGYFSSVIQKIDDVSAFDYARSLNFVLEQLDKNGSTN